MIVTHNTIVPFRPQRGVIDALVNPEWSATAYGNQKFLRRMGFFPRFLPLCVRTDHAPGIPAHLSNDVFTDAPYYLFHSAVYAEFVKESNVPCKVDTFCSPFVYYLLKSNLRRKNGNGSLYFYAHGNNEISPLKSIDIVIDDIRKLPKEFFPVTVCLHYQDLINSVHHSFISEGFDVVCMGNPNDWNFIENYFSILNEFKYTLSSNFSSYSLYSTYFGIPFSLVGEESKFLNHSNTHIPLGEYSTSNEDSNYYKEYKNLFGQLSYEVSESQKVFVDEYLGVRNLSRFRLTYILYRAFFYCLFRLRYWRKYFNYLKLKL